MEIYLFSKKIFLKEKRLQTMICTVASFPYKLLANLKVFLFWLHYKTDGKWLSIHY